MARPSSVVYASLSDVCSQDQWVDMRDVAGLHSGQYRNVTHCLDLDTEGLAGRMCPVQLVNGECVILVLPEYIHDDSVLALHIAMQQAGLKLAKKCHWAVSASQLSAVTRQSRVRQRTPDTRADVAVTPGHVLFCVLDDILGWALRIGASDIHLDAFDNQGFASVAFTVRGCLVRPDQFSSITREVMHELLAVTWMRVQGGNRAVFEPDREQQGRLERTVMGKRLSLRWASIASHRGPSVTLRLLQRDADAETTSLQTLGYSESQLESLYRARLSTGGAVLLAGGVGSGKSTTLAALIRSLPSTRKVVTLEDPIEFDLPNAIQCSITAFGDGANDDDRFDLKLRAIKRSSANDVLIGEIRDAGSARAFSDLLLAGTNVYSTIHAGSALQIIHRLCSPMLGVAPDFLAVPGVLKLLCYQVLVSRLCNHCCVDLAQWLSGSRRYCSLGMPRSEREARVWISGFERAVGMDARCFRFRNLDGCDYCSGQGSHAYGVGGSLMAAEMIEPARMTGFARWLSTYLLGHSGRDAMQSLGHRVVDGGAEMHFEQARDRGLKYLANGWLDPREFELRFGGI